MNLSRHQTMEVTRSLALKCHLSFIFSFSFNFIHFSFIHFDGISFIHFFFQVRVAKTSLTLIGVYIVTWIPIFVIHFVRLAKLAIIPDSVDLAAAFLVSLSCVTNPWIYGFKNNHFRDQLKRMLCVKVHVMRETEKRQMSQFEMK